MDVQNTRTHGNLLLAVEAFLRKGTDVLLLV